jgi:hypothetical protein
MDESKSWAARWKWALIALGIPVVVLAWWEFRPEKLWINQKVDESAPFASTAEPQLIFTGKLSGQAHPTSGRASIYKSANGTEFLRLTDFMTSNGPDVHLLLAQSGDERLMHDTVKDPLDSVELGPLKGNQGDQNYDVPVSADLQKYNAVVVYCERFHAVFGVAKLEPF